MYENFEIKKCEDSKLFYNIGIIGLLIITFMRLGSGLDLELKYLNDHCKRVIK